MKYRELTPKELETYQIGYKVGKQELFITDIQWENEEEHKIYRKGYLAGCKDRHRKKVNNVNNVNNVHSDIDTDTDTENNSRVEIDSIYTTRTHAREKTVEEILNETAHRLSRRANSHLITPDFVFPKNQYFDAYRKELPTATSRTEQWLRRSNLVGKQITETKLGQIIQKFATKK